MKFKYPLASSSWDHKESKAMKNVIDNGFFTMGDKVKQFEEKFANYLGCKYCVMVNSGSSANLLAISSLFYIKDSFENLKRGDEVIVPTVSWSTTYYPLYQYGLKLIFVDIDLYTLNYNLDSLKAAITNKTKAIMIVNLLGNPNNFEYIQDIVKDKKILLIEDNCESLGAEFQEKKAGTFGLLGTYSTFFSHHISTMEGGIISTDNEEIYHILLSLRSHGWTRNLPLKNRVCKKNIDNDFEESFRFVLPGYNLRPLELSGAIGLEQLKKLPNLILERRKNATCYLSSLCDNPNLILQKEIGKSSWFGFSLILSKKAKIDRGMFINRLSEKGIESRPIVSGNFLRNDVIKYFNFEVSGSTENAEMIDSNGLFIGNQHYPIPEIFEIINNIFD